MFVAPFLPPGKQESVTFIVTDRMWGTSHHLSTVDDKYLLLAKVGLEGGVGLHTGST